MKAIISLSVLVLITINLLSQRTVYIESGFGTYAMTDIISFVDPTIRLSSMETLQLNILEEFPATMNYGISIEKEFEKSKKGFGFRYLTTGSRYYYEDFSGFAYKNNIVQAFQFQFEYSRILYNKLFNVAVFLYPSVLLNRYDFQTDLGTTLSSFDVHESNYFSINIGSTAGIDLYKKVSNFTVGFKAGYFYDFVMTKQYPIKDFWPDFSEPKDPALNWRGIRASVYLGYNINSLIGKK